MHSLGTGGWLTAAFDVVLADGPGADLIVGENPFYFGALGETFAEVMFVEVSSNGVDFARVPNAYYGPPTSPGAFGSISVGAYEGLVGMSPVNLGATDPLDVVDAGGDAIDLADLRGDPLVTSGRVDLGAITQVRLVDVRDGIDQDSAGATIYDPGGGSADLDALTALHHAGRIDPDGPVVDVVVPADGAFTIAVDDPNGLLDLDPGKLRATLWGTEVPFALLLQVMNPTRVDANGFTLQLIGTLPPGMLLRVSASAQDLAGNHSGDARSRPNS